MTKDEALRLALAVLKSNDTWGSSIREAKDRAITAIKQALEQAEPEPVVCRHRIVDITNEVIKSGYMCMDCGALFGAYTTSPPKREPEQEPEPVAWRTFDGEGGYDYRNYDMNEHYDKEWAERNPNHVGWVDPLYTSPPKQAPCPYVVSTREGTHYCSLSQREPLTDGQIKELLTTPMSVNGVSAFAFARAIEAAHGIKGEA